jgi:hypothetical protein
MSEVKKCPKCNGKMEIGYLPSALRWREGTSPWQIGACPRIFGYACKNCGYVEFYLGKEGASREQNV